MMFNVPFRSFLAGLSGRKRSSRIRPLKGFGQRIVEIVDERDHFLTEVVEGTEVAAPKKSSTQDTEPYFYLVEPRSVPWSVREANTMFCGAKELLAGFA